MTISIPARADRRSLFGAAALGSCMGLALGGAYLAGGLARTVSPTAPAATAPTFAVEPDTTTLTGAPTRGPGLFHRRARFDIARVAPFALRGALAPPRDLECLSQAVYYEARGETDTGQEAVAQVVLNRVRHPNFPKSVCGVVFQHAGDSCQFSFACDGSTRRRVEPEAWRRAERVARRALSGAVMPGVGAATDFRATHIPAAGLERVIRIGSHVFYRFGGRLGSPAALGGHAQPSAEPTPVLAALSTPDAGQVISAGVKAVERAAAAVVGAGRPAVTPAVVLTAAPPAGAPAPGARPAEAAAPAPSPVAKAEVAPATPAV